MAIEHKNLYHSKTLQNLPKMGFWFEKIYHLATLFRTWPQVNWVETCFPGTKILDPLSLDPDVRVTPSHNDVMEALNGAFLSDLPDLSAIAVLDIGVIPPPPMFRYAG
jgi:hypothetical protein